MNSFRNHRLRDLALQKDKKVKCLGTGRNARWQNIAN